MRPFDRPEPPAPVGPLPPADRLDRAWAATRPTDPSPELLDALWAHASAELDRIDAARAGAVIPLPERRSPRRRRALVGLALAQAAAVLVAAGFAWNRQADQEPQSVALGDTPAGQVVVPSTVPGSRAIVDVEVDKTLVYRIDGPAHRVEQIDQSALAATAGRDVATAHDVFDFFESEAILAEAATRDGFKRAEGSAIP